MECANKLIYDSLEGESLYISEQVIKKSFVFSKSTIKDEERNTKQYESLSFVDF